MNHMIIAHDKKVSGFVYLTQLSMDLTTIQPSKSPWYLFWGVWRNHPNNNLMPPLYSKLRPISHNAN
jgi:hypothetical protein